MWLTIDLSRRLDERMDRRVERSGSAAYAHKVSLGLVLKAPRASLTGPDCIVSNVDREVLLFRL